MTALKLTPFEKLIDKVLLETGLTNRELVFDEVVKASYYFRSLKKIGEFTIEYLNEMKAKNHSVKFY